MVKCLSVLHLFCVLLVSISLSFISDNSDSDGSSSHSSHHRKSATTHEDRNDKISDDALSTMKTFMRQNAINRKYLQLVHAMAWLSRSGCLTDLYFCVAHRQIQSQGPSVHGRNGQGHGSCDQSPGDAEMSLPFRESTSR